MVFLQDNTLSLSVLKPFRDGLLVLTTTLLPKKELFLIIWSQLSNRFHLNSKSKEEGKSFLERLDQSKVILRNLMELLPVVAV